MKFRILPGVLAVCMTFTCVFAENADDILQYNKAREQAEYEAKIGDKTLRTDTVIYMDSYAEQIEAEHFLNDYMTAVCDEEASGGVYIEFANTSNITNTSSFEPQLSFTVKSDKRASYYIWARMYAEDNGSDSLWCGVDADDYKVVYLNDPYREWRWVQLASPVLEPGMHNIHIIPRERHIRIDKFIISRSASFVPTDLGDIPSDYTPEVVFPEPEYYPPANTHPRVYFTADDVPTIRENLTNEQNQDAYSKYKFYKKVAPAHYKHNGSIDTTELDAITCKAFAYAIEGDVAAAREAIDMTLGLGETIQFDSMNTYNKRAALGEYMTVCGFVYDWCFDLLSDEQKELLYEYTVASAMRTEIGYPPVNQGSVFTHGAEDQLQVNLLIPGIAMYDEYPDIYLNTAGRIFDEFVESKELLSSGWCYPGGTHYAGVRLGFDMQCMFIFERMGYSDIYGEGCREQILSYLYNRRPDGGLLYDGDASEKKTTGYISLGDKLYFLAANYFKDPYLKWEFLRNSDLKDISPVEFLCFNDPNVAVKAPDDLPLSRYLPGYRGEMLCRTDWDDGKGANTVVASMKINEYNFAEHQQYDSGAFQIYYKGYLATDSGYYQAAVHETLTRPVQNDGNTHCDSLYCNQYQRRTIAHNCITVTDPNEVFYDTVKGYELENDGGQKAPEKWGSVRRLSYFLDENNGYHVGEVLGHEIGTDTNKPNYTYLKGDLSNAYSDKVSGYERSFMFLNLKNDETPAALLVFDRVDSSNAEFDKKWLLHTLEEPQTDGIRTVASDTREGYGGKLTLDTLLPSADNLDIEKVGGYDTATVSGAKVGDTVYWAKITEGMRNEGGGWRLEISPKASSNTDYFLNVLQVGSGEALDTALIETETHAGAVISDRVVVFGKGRDRTSDNVSFSFDGDGEYEITLADLSAGIWEVYRNGVYLEDSAVTEEGGVATVHAYPGEFEFRYKQAGGEKIFTSEYMPASDYIGIKVNNEFIYCDEKPYINNDRVYVPLRAVSEVLGADVKWNESDKTVTVTKDSRIAVLTVGSSDIVINDITESSDVATEIRNGRVMIPIRFISDAFDTIFDWNKTLRCVNIKTSGAYLDVYTGIKDTTESIPVGEITYSDWNADEIGENTVDGDLSTLWSAQGTEHWIMYDFGENVNCSGFKIIWNKGDQRQEIYNVEVSQDGENFTKIIDTKAEGKSALTYEDNSFGQELEVRYVRINMFGNTKTDWNGIIEIAFY